MPHVRQTAPTLRLLECNVQGDAVVVHGLPYGQPSHPHVFRRLAGAGRVEVIVDLDDIEAVLVQDPCDGGLHRLVCLTSREARLRQLAGRPGAGAFADHDSDVTSSRLRSAA